MSCGENIPGIMCVSAAIPNYKFPAASGVLGTEICLTSKVAEIIQEITYRANRITEKVTRSFLKGGENQPISDIIYKDVEILEVRKRKVTLKI